MVTTRSVLSVERVTKIDQHFTGKILSYCYVSSAYVLIFSTRIRTNFDGNRSVRPAPTTVDNIAHNHSPAIAKHGPHPHPYTASASYHRKSQSLDAATISAQIANHATKINKSHPHHHHHQQHHSTTTNMHKERYV